MQEITITVTIEEANIILAGLGELPAKVSSQLITKVQQQGSEQVKTQQSRENGNV